MPTGRIRARRIDIRTLPSRPSSSLYFAIATESDDAHASPSPGQDDRGTPEDRAADRVSALHRLRKAGRIARGIARDGGAAYRLARAAIRRHAALQRTWELMSLTREVRRLCPRVVVEIGTHRGGTLFCWAAVAAPDALLVSIDLPNPAEGMGSTEGDEARFRAFLRPGQSLSCLRRDSHSPDTRDELVRVLAGRPVDFLWIDGDHGEEGVRADWALYAPLVRPGGLIAFHDINPNPEMPGHQVHHLWRELRARYEHREYVDQSHAGGTGMGIGVLVQAPRGAAG
jgi:predicted O-methyltransferase YrrM